MKMKKSIKIKKLKSKIKKLKLELRIYKCRSAGNEKGNSSAVELSRAASVFARQFPQHYQEERAYNQVHEEGSVSGRY
jgi:hypothetical protein